MNSRFKRKKDLNEKLPKNDKNKKTERISRDITRKSMTLNTLILYAREL